MRELYDTILIIAIISSIIQIKYWKTDGMLLIGLLLILTGIVEYFGAMMSNKHLNNVWLYNIFFPVEFTIFSISILNKISFRLYKRVIFLALGIYILFELINIIFIQTIYEFHTISFIIGSLLMVISSGLFLHNLIKEMNENKTFFREPYFWICTGLLFFYSGNFLFMSSMDFIGSKYPMLTHKLFLITELLGIVEYTMIIIAFLCRRTFQKFHS